MRAPFSTLNLLLELERVLTHMLIERAITNIIIDGKKPKWYERRLKKILRDKGISVRKLRTKRAHQSAGVRVADMVAGPVRSYFDGKHPERIAPYYKRMEKKIQVLIQ